MIKIKNAYENNLKNISLDIPLNQIVSVIGVSGSGKSTLIYNVIANEAKRREKIDSGNATCLDFAIRAKFDEIKNLPYAITLKQRGIKQSISSTIATITKLSELLREEFVKYGEIKNEYGNIIKEPSPQNIIKFIQKYYSNEKFDYFAVVSYKKYTDGQKELNILKKNGIKEAIFISSYNNKETLKKINSVKSLNKNYHHTILVPIKKLEELENFQNVALESYIIRNKKVKFNFYYDFPDLKTGKIYQRKSTELLSFNSISEFNGKCHYCNGKGIIETTNWNKLILKDKHLNDFFLNLETNQKECYKYIGLCKDSIIRYLKNNKINILKTFSELNEKEQETIKNFIKDKILKHKEKVSINLFIKEAICPKCKGSRLNYKANAVKLYNKSISELLNFEVDELYKFLKNKKLHHKKILSILASLKKATLGYLELNRTTDTLSGGELQRLKLAIELNEEYKNLLYILDEPSTGLHPYNNYQIIELIKELKNKGNSVILSEHNIEYIKNSDYIIELGPKGGVEGGQIIFSGTDKEFNETEFKRNKLNINLNNSIVLNGVNINNIVNENFIIPLNCLVTISGVSGSGKSSLVHKALSPIIKEYLKTKNYDNSIINEVKNIEKIKDIVELSQSQIGNNSRSIIATYLDIFDYIRELFASSELAKEMNFDKSYFSFNSEKGRCEFCKGMGETDGIICPNCQGQRYKTEILEITYKDMNIYEFLNTPIELLKNKIDNSKLLQICNLFSKLGMHYLTFGRVTPTLSGGESQRLRLIKIMLHNYKKIKNGNILFIFDEPTTGLNEKNIVKLYEIFDEILKYNNSVLIIEHNLNIIKNSDFIIDIGLESGKNGGKNIFSGTYENLLKHKDSLTAKALRGEFQKDNNKILLELNSLKEKNYSKNYDYKCNEFYLNEKHFQIEKEFAKNFNVLTDKKQHIFFKTKEELFKFIGNLNVKNIAFNPYTTELFKYKKVPLSIKKTKIKYLKKLGFKVNSKDYEIDEWKYRIYIDDLKKAYNFGKGWLTVETENNIYELFTRLVSLEHKIIGSSKIDEKTFNLYLNSCNYCNGEAKLSAYDNLLLIKNYDKTILDKDFLNFNLKLNLKTIIKRFKDENIFDFTKPFNELNEEEKNIFLFGFQEYKFLKKGGRINALSDYIEWKGLYRYIFENLSKIDISEKIIDSKYYKKCPFCNKGFKNEVEFYNCKNKTILDYM
jgi:excinuclease ABC subunit A